MTDVPWTPGPWKWEGEDYRAGWGWQILVGPNGEGLVVGEGHDGGLFKGLRAHMPLDPALCKTGMLAGPDSANAVHVFSQANARLIAEAPAMAEVLDGTTGAFLAVLLENLAARLVMLGTAEDDDLVVEARHRAAKTRAILARIKGAAP